MLTIAELPADLFSAAVALWDTTGLTRPWNDADADLRRAISGPASTVLAARSADGLLLGTAMVGHDGHRGWVYYLAVQPTAQNQGIGRALMGACEEWVAARGIPKIQLMVRRDNTGVVAFYETLGYSVADAIVLGRPLTPRGSHDTA